jgi:hypothetical protein
MRVEADRLVAIASWRDVGPGTLIGTALASHDMCRTVAPPERLASLPVAALRLAPDSVPEVSRYAQA